MWLCNTEGQEGEGEAMEYTSIKDIPYIEDVNGTSDRKHTTDLYLPAVRKLDDDLSSGEESWKSRGKVPTTDESGRFPQGKKPLVVFVHGGGWRRGDKDGWRHFLCEDINMLVAFIHWCQGLYGNVGECFAKRGIPCAVMSYPLAKLKSPWILLELMTSYLCSALFLGVVFSSILLIFSLLDLLTPFCLYNYISPLSHIRRLSSSSAMSMLLLHLTLTNVVELCLITVQYRNYKLTPVSTSAILLSSIPSAGLLNSAIHLHTFLLLFLVTLITSQGILLTSNLLSNQASPSDQVTALMRCIARLQSLGKEGGWFDPHSIFLMGHSAGGHLCSLAALDLTKQDQYEIKSRHLKGVIAVSAVLHVENMNYNPVSRLYLHPSFGKDPQHWSSVCPLNNLKSHTQSHAVPHFLVISAQYDFHLARDAASFSHHLEDLHDIDAEHTVIPGTNHTSIICNIDKSSHSEHPSLLDICLQYIYKRMS